MSTQIFRQLNAQQLVDLKGAVPGRRKMFTMKEKTGNGNKQELERLSANSNQWPTLHEINTITGA